MDWNTSFSGERFGDSSSPDAERTGYERDWDRLIFSSAFRRLQNKTQVFPLPDEVFVHNRLTHSLEVASVGRSLGKIVGSQISQFAAPLQRCGQLLPPGNGTAIKHLLQP